MRRGTKRGMISGLTLAAFAGILAWGQGPAEGEKYALLVGVRQYDPVQPLPTLTYPEDDIEELARVLVASGYKRENIKLMTQREGARNARFTPTTEKIRKEFGATLRRLEPGDSVVVALAGHGVQFTQEGDSFFCPADADLDDEKTLIKLGEVATGLESCRAGFKLLLVDACRNNPKLRVARAGGRAISDPASLSRPFLRVAPGGMAALFSCSPGEIAFENPDLKHGVFFHYIIEGLRGEADRDHDGRVEVEELASYAKRNVARYVDLTYGREQTPEQVIKTRGTVAVVRAGGTAARPEAPKIDATRVVSKLGLKLAPIPAGEFLMGSPDSDKDAQAAEKPQHRVRITRPFYLGVTEVTVGQFRKFVEAAG